MLWRYQRLGWATKFYKQWFFWATHSRLQPVIDVAYMIKRHLYGVLNYFSAARITNAAAEGLNSKIQTIKKMAYGYRNRSTSRPPSSSTAVGYSFTQLPTEKPDDPNFNVGHRPKPLRSGVPDCPYGPVGRHRSPSRGRNPDWR